jgi:NAD-dependent SIR2 family protein deacetylase
MTDRPGADHKREVAQCIRCDSDVPTDPLEGLTLTYNQERGAVKVCEDCVTVVKERNHWDQW